MAFRHKERIVAETAAAFWLVDDHTLDRAGAGKLGQQPLAVALIIGILARVARRADPGAPPSASTSRPESSATTSPSNARDASEALSFAFSSKVAPDSTVGAVSGCAVK